MSQFSSNLIFLTIFETTCLDRESRNYLIQFYFLLEGQEYFKVNLKETKIEVEVIKTIPEKFAYQFPVCQLVLIVGVRETNHQATTVLSIKIGLYD